MPRLARALYYTVFSILLMAVTMSSNAHGEDRLWLQITQSCNTPKPKGPQPEAVPILVPFVSDLIASSVGALIKSAADTIAADERYTIETVLAYEPAFSVGADSSVPEFLPTCVTLNVGKDAVKIIDQTTKKPLFLEDVIASDEYNASPVVIQLTYTPSQDKTALAGRVNVWKYDKFIDPKTVVFRKPAHRVTIEVKFAEPDGTAILTNTLQIKATETDIGSVKPAYGELLPWTKRPTKSAPDTRPQNAAYDFGPVNVSASIAEIAEASGFAKVFSTSLAAQQQPIETLIRDRITQSLDASAAAQAKITALSSAQTARDQYETAYNEAKTAVDAYLTSRSDADKQKALLKLAVLKQREILARDAFDKASISFIPLPAITQI
jgi:hypothetical protein